MGQVAPYCIIKGKDAFGSVGVCDEACQLNGKYESTVGSLYGWHDHSPPHKAWEKVDQMVVRVQEAPNVIHTYNVNNVTFCRTIAWQSLACSSSVVVSEDHSFI